MIKVIILSLFWVLSSFAVDSVKKDNTLPLNQRTRPDSQGNQTESGLLKNRKTSKVEPAASPAVSSVQDPSRPQVGGVETFGTDKINAYALKKFLGKDLSVWIAKGLAGDASAPEWEKKLAERVKKKYEFAYTDWSVTQYMEPEGLKLFMTLEVVEDKDVARRMPFRPIPTETLEDPGGVVAAWLEYEQLAFDLIGKDLLEPESEKCVAFHCPFGHQHTKLKKFEKIFVEGVKKHKNALVQFRLKDGRELYRAAACYVLAYLSDGNEVIRLMQESLHDPSFSVRNNALRVLGDVTEYHPQLVVSVAPILEALAFPKVSDRMKAVYILNLMVMNSNKVREEVLKHSIPDLFALMNTEQPYVQELTHGVLRKVSGKDYAAKDQDAWRLWQRSIASQK